MSAETKTQILCTCYIAVHFFGSYCSTFFNLDNGTTLNTNIRANFAGSFASLDLIDLSKRSLVLTSKQVDSDVLEENHIRTDCEINGYIFILQLYYIILIYKLFFFQQELY